MGKHVAFYHSTKSYVMRFISKKKYPVTHAQIFGVPPGILDTLLLMLLFIISVLPQTMLKKSLMNKKSIIRTILTMKLRI